MFHHVLVNTKTGGVFFENHAEWIICLAPIWCVAPGWRIRHHLERQNGFKRWRLLYREYKLDTATRQVGLLPGDAESLLGDSVTMAQPIQWATLSAREKVVARGVATALRGLIGGKALSCIRHHPERQNGFKMWRLLYREYKLDTATRQVGLLERVLDDQPAPGMDF